MGWHYIKPNDSSALPRRIIFFDTETYRIKTPDRPKVETHKLRLGVAKIGKLDGGRLTRQSKLIFYSAAQFWEWVEKQINRNETTWIVAHNIIYDLRAVEFTEQFTKAKWVLDSPRYRRQKAGEESNENSGRPLAVMEGALTIIGMRHVASGCRCVAVDLFNWFQDSLATLGDMVGLPKMTMPDENDSNEKWLAYCENDVDILQDVFCRLVNWVKDNDFGMFRYSAAGQAFSAWRHRFMPHKVCTHDESEVKALERKAYYGGESGCFFIGEVGQKVYHLDVTSLFPFVMKNAVFPCKLLRWEMRRQPLALMPDILPENSVAEVVLASSDRTYPYRPHGRTIHATGSIFTALAGPELHEAFYRGHIRAWKSWAEYDCKPLFADYVTHLFGLKKQYNDDGNLCFERLAKMMLNFLYGKFGQLSPQWKDDKQKMAEKPWEAWLEVPYGDIEPIRFRSIGWSVQKNVGRVERPQSFPAICAFITAAARQYMQRLRTVAGQQNCYYQCVDSLITNEVGYGKLASSGCIGEGVLGKLRVLRTGDSCVISNIGDYSVADYRVRVGFKKTAVDNGDGSWRQQQFDGPHTIFKYAGDKSVRTHVVTKTPVARYAGGEILPSGQVVPFCISDTELSEAISGESNATSSATTSKKSSDNG